MAVGVTHGWRAALGGTLAASLALVALVGFGTPLLANAASLARLELVIGPFLVLFGIAWLRKAIWRYAGSKALHDEAAIYAREVAALRNDARPQHWFAVAFQGVFVEGLEVAVVVVTFAAQTPQLIGWSVGGALAAFAAVAIAAFALRAPLARVPENLLKSVVGVMLLSLGTLWTGEGLGLRWWYGDATLFALVAGCALLAAAMVRVLRARAA
jgi:uncharacterized membrane protein